MIKPLTDEQLKQKQERLELNKEVVELINTYAHKSLFLSSLREQINKNRELTEAQIESAKRTVDYFILRDLENQKVVEMQTKKSNIAVGDVITVNNTMAVKIGIQAGFDKKFHNIEIMEVIEESFGSVTVRAVTCYKKVAHCGICGLTLTDPESIARGIGPVCGRRRNVMKVEDLNQALGKAEIVVRVPRSTIKNVFKFETETKGE